MPFYIFIAGGLKDYIVSRVTKYDNEKNMCLILYNSLYSHSFVCHLLLKFFSLSIRSVSSRTAVL